MSPNLDPKAPLSVVIITKNESTRIRECIQSVLWADDIVVVDDESTDDTAAIARELGARVEVRRMDNEGRHRNAAYAMAKNEWVFSLDADERVTPELEAEIRQILIAGTPCNGFGVPRKNYVGKYWAGGAACILPASSSFFAETPSSTRKKPRSIRARSCMIPAVSSKAT
jgi:glycosyltransferase involved in cell wall biosynthesis